MKLIVPLFLVLSVCVVHANIAVLIAKPLIDALVSAVGEGVKNSFDKNYVRIVNTMGPDVEITANCASGDDKIDETKLKDGGEMAWEFKDNVWGTTLFWCDVTTSDGKKKHWDVYTYDPDVKAHNWYLRGDGIYKGKRDGSELEKKQDWEKM